MMMIDDGQCMMMIYDDDVYEYDSIGIPFFAELGREIIRIVQSK